MAAFVPGLREKKRPFHYNVEQQSRVEQRVEKEAGREKKDREGDMERLRRAWHCYVMQSETVLL